MRSKAEGPIRGTRTTDRHHSALSPVNGLLRRLLSESAIYGLGAGASQIVGIVLIPIYARELGTANYGVLAVLNTTISLSSTFAGFALAQSFFRSYMTQASSDRDREHVLAVALTLRLLLSAAAVLVLLAAAVPLGTLILGREGPGLILLLIPIVFFDTLNVIPLSYLRSERRPRTYMLIALTRAVLGSVLIVVLVVWAQMGVRGALIGSAAAAVTTAGLGIWMLRANGLLHWGWDGPVARALLTYAAPLVPAAAAGWALSFADRYLVLGMEGQGALGIYAAGYSIGLVINVFVVQPFSLMWGPTKWEIYRDDPDAPRVFSRVLTAFIVAASSIALAVAAVSTDVIRLLLTPEFEDARFVVPFVAFAYVLYGAYLQTSTGLSITARTIRVAATVAAAAAANIVANLALIPLFGFMGAAYATLLSYALLAISAAVISQPYYPIRWEVVRVSLSLMLGIGLSLAALLGPDTPLWRAACLLAYPALIFGLRVVSLGELRRSLRLSR